MHPLLSRPREGPRHRLRRALLAPRLFVALSAATPLSALPTLGAQQPARADALDTLVAEALRANPVIRAAASRVEAARARIAPAGARPDPMLMAGVQNFPVSEPGFADVMTMKMVGIEQTIPYRGKLALRTRAARSDLEAARAGLDASRLAVAREVRVAYYDVAFATEVFAIVERNQTMLAGLARATEARYAVGASTQPDVLRARVELARLAEEGSALAEDRRAALARLNAALDRASDAPLDAAFPERVVRAAVADSARRITFASTALGARVASSPVPPLDSLQAMALRTSPTLRAHEAMIAAEAARAALAAKEHLPDVDVSVQYGQRAGLGDMVTATISLPLPIQRRRKQDAHATEVRAALAALEAEHHVEVNRLRAEVATLHASLERDRAQLALYVTAIVPQARAALTSATAGYEAGRIGFAALIESQATVFNYETQYHRALTDFAKTLAELEERVGTEVLR